MRASRASRSGLPGRAFPCRRFGVARITVVGSHEASAWRSNRSIALATWLLRLLLAAPQPVEDDVVGQVLQDPRLDLRVVGVLLECLRPREHRTVGLYPDREEHPGSPLLLFERQQVEGHGCSTGSRASIGSPRGVQSCISITFSFLPPGTLDVSRPRPAPPRWRAGGVRRVV